MVPIQTAGALRKVDVILLEWVYMRSDILHHQVKVQTITAYQQCSC